MASFKVCVVFAFYVSTVAVLDNFSRNGITVMLLVDILMPYFKFSNIRNKHTTDRQVLRLQWLHWLSLCKATVTLPALTVTL